MRIGLIEFLLILAIASLTVGPRVALFVDRWMRRANRANAMAARRRAEYAAQMAAERDAMLKRFRTASTVFGVGILLVLVYALGFRPIDTPPQTYKAPDLRQETGAMQTAVSTDRKTRLELGEYQGVDCIRAKDGLLYAAAWNGAALKKRTSDLVRTDGGHAAAILSVEGELTGFAFDAAGDVWLTQLTTAGGTLCRAKHDSWGAAVEQVVTQLDGAPLGAVSAVEVSPAGKVYFAVAAAAGAENGLESALRTELLAHTATGCVYVYDPRRPHSGKGAGRGGRCCRSGAQPGRQHPVCLRPWQPLHLGGGRRCPGADRRGTGLHRCLCRSAGLSRSAGCGHGRHAVHQLPLGAQRLAGKERGQHPAAGHCPAGGAEYAGAAVPVHRRCPLRRGGKPCNRGLGADLYRSCTGQLCGGVSGGKQSIFRCGRGRQPAGCKPISEVFFV